jgi:hypothetical protein
MTPGSIIKQTDSTETETRMLIGSAALLLSTHWSRYAPWRVKHMKDMSFGEW